MAEGFAGHTPGEPFGDVRAGLERDVHADIGFDRDDLPAEEWRERYFRADRRASVALDKLDSLHTKLGEEVRDLRRRARDAQKACERAALGENRKLAAAVALHGERKVIADRLSTLLTESEGGG